MMEFVLFIAQDNNHFAGFLVILFLSFIGLGWLIIAIGMAIAAARGYGLDDCECENAEDHN